MAYLKRSEGQAEWHPRLAQPPSATLHPDAPSPSCTVCGLLVPTQRSHPILLDTALTTSVSSQIISSVIPGAGIVRTMEWTLLLSVLSLPGVFLGAAIVKYTGRRNLLMMGFSG